MKTKYLPASLLYAIKQIVQRNNLIITYKRYTSTVDQNRLTFHKFIANQSTYTGKKKRIDMRSDDVKLLD